jgi:hypothetical protein
VRVIEVEALAVCSSVKEAVSDNDCVIVVEEDVESETLCDKVVEKVRDAVLSCVNDGLRDTERVSVGVNDWVSSDDGDRFVRDGLSLDVRS